MRFANVPNWSHEPQDAVCVNETGTAGAVLDGLAGHPGAEVAAQLSVMVCADRFAGAGRPGWALETFHACRDAVSAARADGPAEHADMAAAAVIAALSCDGHWDVAWAGDCRAYLLTAGRARMVSADHDLLYHQAQTGRLTDAAADSIRLRLADCDTASDAFRAAGAVGKRAFKRQHEMYADVASGTVGHVRVPAESGQVLMLCSDGVHGNLLHRDMTRLMLDTAPDELAGVLVDASQARALAGIGKAHPDDITCAVLTA